MLGLIGKKLGMTRLFLDSGESVPVTVISVENNRVVQVKTKESDGYDAIQVAFGVKKVNRLSSALKGHYAKHEAEAGKILKEFRLDNPAELKSGDILKAELFKDGDFIDVSAKSKGKGFAGVIERHNFSSNRASHGNSVSHNAPGSIGQRQDPGRVFPGKKMAGHLGAVMVTTQNLTVFRVDNERDLILIKGAVPGARGSFVTITPSIKKGVKA